VIAVGVIAWVIAAPIGLSAFTALDPYEFEDKSTESAEVSDRIEEASGVRPDAEVIALLDSDVPVRSEQGRARLEEMVTRLSGVEGIARVTDPLDSEATVSRDGRSAYVVAQVRSGVTSEEIMDRAESEFEDDDDVLLGGSAAASAQFASQVQIDLERGELLAFPLLMLLLLIFFRGLVAAAIPMAIGGMALVGSLAGMRLIHEALPLIDQSLSVVTALGFGLAIDYSLFMVARFREELDQDPDPETAVRRTVHSTGHAVAFSGMTVGFAMLVMLVFPQRFLVSMALAGAMVAILAATIALTVLPAILVLLGERVNAAAPRWLRYRPVPLEQGRWYRLTRGIMRRPVLIAAASATALILAGLPFLRINFVPAVESAMTEFGPAFDEGPSVGRVDRIIRLRFPPAPSSPIIVDLEGGERVPAAVMQRYRGELAELPGVTSVSNPLSFGGVTRIDVATDATPLSDQAQGLVGTIRALDAPTPARERVGGIAASQVDEEASVSKRIPYAVALLVLATTLLLVLMTGSVVLPIKSLIMNLLTISAAFGVLVLVFQDGRLERLLDYTSQGGIQMVVPVLVFAVTFGLSTDYGVLVLSRIREARDDGAGNDESVAIGMERTGRLVTAAALLFAVVMFGLLVGQVIGVKEIGFTIAVAVLIDAFVVRALLVPSLMKLLGDRNWWAPEWVARLTHAHARPVETGSEVSQ